MVKRALKFVLPDTFNPEFWLLSLMKMKKMMMNGGMRVAQKCFLVGGTI